MYITFEYQIKIISFSHLNNISGKCIFSSSNTKGKVLLHNVYRCELHSTEVQHHLSLKNAESVTAALLWQKWSWEQAGVRIQSIVLYHILAGY